MTPVDSAVVPPPRVMRSSTRVSAPARAASMAADAPAPPCPTITTSASWSQPGTRDSAMARVPAGDAPGAWPVLVTQPIVEPSPGAARDRGSARVDAEEGGFLRDGRPDRPERNDHVA